MTKIRKQKKKKTYRHTNKRKLNKKMKRLPKIRCPLIKEAWSGSKSARHNMEEMGLVFDTKTVFKIPTTKELIKGETSSQSSTQQPMKGRRPCKQFVVEQLEAEAKAPREKMLRLPDGQARWLAYLVDKYGDDYKAMARDDNNFYQETWKQLRAKIRTLKSIPGQLEEFLAKDETQSQE